MVGNVYETNSAQSADALQNTATPLGPTWRMTQVGNADWFVFANSEEMRFCHAKGWLVWDGRNWRAATQQDLIARAKSTLLAMEKAAKLLPADQQLGALRHVLSSETLTQMKAMVELATADERIAVAKSDLDSDPFKLACLNGTLDLRRGLLLPHNRADLITRIAPVCFNPNARLDLWDRLVCDLTGGDEELASFLQRLAGYCLTASTQEDKFAILYGPGGTGKTTFIEALRRTWGEYGASANSTTWMPHRDPATPRGDIVRLDGARLVVSSETEKGSRIAEAMVKSLTGGDTITGRELYQSNVEFQPRFKLIVVTNAPLGLDVEDTGMRRRLLAVRMDSKVKRVDPTLRAQLCDPAVAGPAILAWAVKGAQEWHKRGLDVPHGVEQMTEEYSRQVDPIGVFLTTRCQFGPTLRIASGDLWAEFCRWLGETPCPTRKAFSDRLREKGAQFHITHINGRDARVISGIALA
jgi:putative DNA primase/helicase